MKILFTCLLSTLMVFASCSKQNTKHPNIIVFLVDDMGWQETSIPFYKDTTNLNRRFQTPNMERLASKGTIFTQAYASPICSPSRVSLMTGINPAKHKVNCWTLRKDESPEFDHPTLMKADWNVNGLSPVPETPASFFSAHTLPSLLKKVNYHTIHVGKAHWGALDTPGENPLNFSYDVNIAGHAAGGPGSYHGDKNFSAVWRNGSPVWNVPGLDKYHGRKINLTEALSIETGKALDSAVQLNQPFFLHFAHYTVHAPWEADRRYIAKYPKEGLTDLQAKQASMIEGMDASLGSVLDKLEEHGITENTIIVFLSDNGQPRQVDRNLPLRGHKISPYEGGIRVPLIVKWPAKEKQVPRTEHPVVIQDVFASVIEWAGVTQKDLDLSDSKSFLPYLTQQSPAKSDREFIWNYPTNYDVSPYCIIRKGAWKLIYHYADQRKELFNIEEDISESQNLVEQETAVADSLSKLLSDYLRQVQAVVPRFKKDSSYVPLPDEI